MNNQNLKQSLAVSARPVRLYEQLRKIGVINYNGSDGFKDHCLPTFSTNKHPHSTSCIPASNCLC